MKFSTHEDVSAPAEFVFKELSEFESFERLASHRGARITRVDSLAEPGVGMCWDVDFQFRNKARSVRTEVVRFEAPEFIGFSGQSSNFTLMMTVMLTALSQTRTRIQVGLDIRPRTLSARLLMQSAKLGRASLDRKFEGGVRTIARDLEHHSTAP